MTLSGSKDKPFRGFMMAGFRDTCDSMEIVGEYIKYDVPANKSKAFACGEGARVSHEICVGDDLVLFQI